MKELFSRIFYKGYDERPYYKEKTMFAVLISLAIIFASCALAYIALWKIDSHK